MKKIITHLFLFILLILYLIVGNHFNIYLFCPFYKITKLYCPGCGVTRMLLSILHGNFYQAFRFNPLIFIMLPFFIIYYILYIISLINKKDFIIKKIDDKLWIYLIIIFITYGILRNIPLFSYLRPTVIK